MKASELKKEHRPCYFDKVMKALKHIPGIIESGRYGFLAIHLKPKDEETVLKILQELNIHPDDFGLFYLKD